MSNPSPKPWSYKKDKWEDGFIILDASDESVTEMGCGCCSPSGVGVWNEDDARVIAAAPDLLEALEEAISMLGSRLIKDTFGYEWHEKATGAIEKARGES